MTSIAQSRRHHRRGVVLAGIVMLLAVLAAVFAVLTTVTVSEHRARRLEELNRTARIAADGVVELVTNDAKKWIALASEEPVDIPIDQLAPARTTVVVHLSCVTVDSANECSVEVKVDSQRLNAVERRTWTVE